MFGATIIHPVFLRQMRGQGVSHLSISLVRVQKQLVNLKLFRMVGVPSSSFCRTAERPSDGAVTDGLLLWLCVAASTRAVNRHGRWTRSKTTVRKVNRVSSFVVLYLKRCWFNIHMSVHH